VPELAGRELLDEWRRLMDSIISSAASVTGRSELPRDLLRAMQRQLTLVQDVLERERGFQRELASRVIAPVDAVFDMVEESSVMLRQQAEALEAAGRALAEAAGLMKLQAELVERTVVTVRHPADLVRAPGRAKQKKPGRAKPRQTGTAGQKKPGRGNRRPSKGASSQSRGRRP